MSYVLISDRIFGVALLTDLLEINVAKPWFLATENASNVGRFWSTFRPNRAWACSGPANWSRASSHAKRTASQLTERGKCKPSQRDHAESACYDNGKLPAAPWRKIESSD